MRPQGHALYPIQGSKRSVLRCPATWTWSSKPGTVLSLVTPAAVGRVRARNCHRITCTEKSPWNSTKRNRQPNEAEILRHVNSTHPSSENHYMGTSYWTVLSMTVHIFSCLVQARGKVNIPLLQRRLEGGQLPLEIVQTIEKQV